MTAIVHGDVLPDLGGHVERPNLVGHGGVLQGTTIHKYLVAEEHARVRVSRQWRATLDVRRLPDVAVIIIYVYHLGTVETLATNHVQRIFPDDRTVTGRPIRRQILVRDTLPKSTIALLAAVCA